MKKFFSMLLVLALCLSAFTACDRKSTLPETDDASGGEFMPEDSGVSGGLTQAVAAQGENVAADGPGYEIISPEDEALDVQMDVAMDTPLEPSATADDSPAARFAPTDASSSDATPADSFNAVNQSAGAQPFAVSTPQPNASVTSYQEVAANGLGFKFSYPTGWNSIPGYSTVCYVQPVENGTVYPARVSITMKQLNQTCNEQKAQKQLALFLQNLRTQYDEKSFEVNMELDTSTRFMDNNAISTTYLAFDGDQEIKGYVILTYFRRYVYCFHFLSAYEDYPSFESAMRHMRDSVKADESQEAPKK